MSVAVKYSDSTDGDEHQHRSDVVASKFWRDFLRQFFLPLHHGNTLRVSPLTVAINITIFIREAADLNRLAIVGT
jgi:hypothetical protein